MIFLFFVISIFVVVKERVVNSNFMLQIIVFSCYFLVFVRHFLVYLSELFCIKFVRAAIFIMLLLFCFVALNQSIYLSIYLPSIYLPICLYEVMAQLFEKEFYKPKQYHLSKPFIVKFRFKQRLYTNFIGLCRYVLPSKIVELDSQNLLFVPMF